MEIWENQDLDLSISNLLIALKARGTGRKQTLQEIRNLTFDGPNSR